MIINWSSKEIIKKKKYDLKILCYRDIGKSFTILDPNIPLLKGENSIYSIFYLNLWIFLD